MLSFEVLLLLLLGVFTATATQYDIVQPASWWDSTVLYEMWVESFKDSDGDGIGDLDGITSKLSEVVEIGVETVWLSPFYPSPMVDSGYDVSDYRNVYPAYGTLDDFNDLVTRAKELGLRVVLEYVPNHTSDEHEWFIKSKNGIEPYTDYYVWNKGILDANGTRQPPNNWLSAFNSGSAWEWVEERQAYYLHQFSVHQPDVNFRNPLVIQETKDILTFWLNRNIDGICIDSVPFLIEASSLADEPLSGLFGCTSTDYHYLDHIYTKDQPENYPIVQAWRDHIDNYTATKNDGKVRAIFTEAYSNISEVMKYYDYGANVPLNFFFIKDANGIDLVKLDAASDVVDVINKWMANMPSGGTANWMVGNHDYSRVATRHGSGLIDALNFLLFLLSGVAAIYNGDELGMTDTYLSCEETTDLQACSTNPFRFQSCFRDRVRTPYQWDNSTSAGFSTNSTTELPVNPNYLTLNLAAQKEANVSHYKNVQAAIKLRNTKVMREGNLIIQFIEDVVAFIRELDGEDHVVMLANWANNTSTVSLELFTGLSGKLEVLIADINSGISVGDQYEKDSVTLPGNAAIVLRSVSERSGVTIDLNVNFISSSVSSLRALLKQLI